MALDVHATCLTDASGPYAFMDIFDPMHVCNHTDEEGRYAYKVHSSPGCPSIIDE